jgi:hypothetical protein
MMATYRKRDIADRLEGLERYYRELREALEGRAPSGSTTAMVYGVTEEELPRYYTNIDFDDVLLKLDHFKAEVTAIKALKSKVAKPRPR